MIVAPDTNILVRIFLDDTSSGQQINAARKLATEAKQLYVTQLVQVELVWVLESAYDLKKVQILTILEKLRTHSIFKLQHSHSFEMALALYQKGTADFADYLIWTETQETGARFYTFDKQLVKSGAAELTT